MCLCVFVYMCVYKSVGLLTFSLFYLCLKGFLCCTAWSRSVRCTHIVLWSWFLECLSSYPSSRPKMHWRMKSREPWSPKNVYWRVCYFRERNPQMLAMSLHWEGKECLPAFKVLPFSFPQQNQILRSHAHSYKRKLILYRKQKGPGTEVQRPEFFESS